ncbi:MAG: SOS response-associated peptidase [Betaproteobacteria bacterium]|nr:MAG: SOS response-associated peptidase [Betaproteobacteria bacterium]
MCGRFALHANPQVIALQFALASLPGVKPRYNIAPTTDVLIVRAADAAVQAALVRWGLVPRWAKDPAMGAKLNHARAETVADKASFREALRKRRCLIPASGFYEWKAEGGRKQPYYVRPAQGELFAFAGLWEAWRGPDGVLETCTVVTTDANAAMQPVHDRMPVIVARRDYARWLDCASGDDVRDLLRPCDPADIAVRRVSRAVNNARNEGSSLIETEAS